MWRHNIHAQYTPHYGCTCHTQTTNRHNTNSTLMSPDKIGRANHEYTFNQCKAAAVWVFGNTDYGIRLQFSHIMMDNSLS